MVNFITQKIAHELNLINPRTPKSHNTPKIDKKGNPDQSVIRPEDCHTLNISWYIEHHFQPVVKETPLSLKILMTLSTK